MSQLFLLVKTGMWNQWRICELKQNKDKKKRNHLILMICVYVLIGSMAVTYAAAGAVGLVYMKLADLIPAAGLTLTSIFALFFTVFKTNGILFGFQDYDMLASLPVSHSTLVASRFMQLYLTNLLGSVLIMLPMGIVYGISEGRGSFFYMIWVLSIFAAPLIPTTLASIAGVLVMAVSVRMKHQNAVSAVLSILLVVAILAGSSGLGSMGEKLDLTQLGSLLRQAEQSLEKLYPVNRLFTRAVRDENLFYFILFLAGSYLWYRLFVAVTAMKYKRIQSALTAHRKTTGKKTALSYEMREPMQALVSKEWKRFWHSNIYLMNMGMGVIMLCLATAAILLIPDQSIVGPLAENGISFNLSETGGLLAPFLVAGIGNMSCTTCCALSLEGKSIELLKTLPLKPIEIYNSKIKMNLMLILPPGLICSFLLGIRFSVGLTDGLFLVLLPVTLLIFNAVWGMFINIKMPDFSWENEVIVVKQSMPSFFGLFSGMLLALVCGFLVFLVPEEFRNAVRGLIVAVIAAFTVILYQKIEKLPLPEDR